MTTLQNKPWTVHFMLMLKQVFQLQGFCKNADQVPGPPQCLLHKLKCTTYIQERIRGIQVAATEGGSLTNRLSGSQHLTTKKKWGTALDVQYVQTATHLLQTY